MTAEAKWPIYSLLLKRLAKCETGSGQVSECRAVFHVESDAADATSAHRPGVLAVEALAADIRACHLDGGLRLREIMLTETLDHPPATQPRLSRLAPLTRRIEGQYHEMPGLKLTEAQAQRLWNLDAHTCRIVLITLMQRRFLRRTVNGRYIRAEG